LPCLSKAPPSGFGYPLGGVSSPALGRLLRRPTLMGFSLQGFFPSPRRVRCFQRTFRPYAFLPNSPAWHRRSDGLRTQPQQCLPRPEYFSTRGGADTLLGFRTFRATFRRIWGEALSFPMPLMPFSFLPPKKQKPGTPGDSSRRTSFFLLSEDAHPPGVPDRLSSATS
jgi:hypothetical protein